MNLNQREFLKYEYLSRCVEALSMLQAPLGIHGVLGNHDFRSGPEVHRTICDTYFSRGVGCLLAPVRLNCLPEATVLTLT